MVNMDVQVEICSCEVVWRVNNSRKSAILYNILYHFNVIFLQRIFEGLKSVFSKSKTTRQKCTKGTLSLCSSNERDQIDLSNGVNCSSNRAFMRKLQRKQWRVNCKTQLASKSHHFLLHNRIEAQEKSMEIY
jgi:hypothetical protein